ncbi:sugar kinase [Paenibacillus agri]|uniref:Sugar kinase n=1 Tax=Paenibacillus agri TaxID=2744309 RepID=A0A850ED58_9BACL|nr:sugar kinase [Paenibacillus agri]NUU59183.1 sugar kinase [Paenibacillus agri]
MPKKIAAFGEVMMRLQVPGHDLLSQSNMLRYSFSGTGVNMLSALANFGHTGCLISRLPHNPVGDAAAAELRGLGISTKFLQRGGDYMGMYFLENGFGVRPGRVTYTNRLESSFNTAPEGTYDYGGIAQSIAAIHFCGITLAMNDAVRSHMKALALAVKAQGGLVIFDSNYRASLWGAEGHTRAKPYYEDMLKLADIVMMTEKDALWTLGMSTDKEGRKAQLEELIPAVADEYGIKIIAGTHREIHGDNSHSLLGYIYKDQSLVFADPLRFSVYDRIGAGDAYASGIIHGELEGWPAEQTVRFAAVAGMLAHTISGDTPKASEGDILRAMTEAVGDVER